MLPAKVILNIPGLVWHLNDGIQELCRVGHTLTAFSTLEKNPTPQQLQHSGEKALNQTLNQALHQAQHQAHAVELGLVVEAQVSQL